jgi:hypothetical protein
MRDKQKLNNIILEQVTNLASELDTALRRHMESNKTELSISLTTKNHIKKRVPPTTFDAYVNADKALSLILLELNDLGLRISRYMFIGRYREYLQTSDADIGSAFAMHILTLRGSEIYIIMERCCDFLRFLHGILKDQGLASVDISASLEKQFKKQFSRHLLERHRIVHSHERPSLASRITNINANDFSEAQRRDIFAVIMARLMDAYNSVRLPPKEQQPFGEFRQKIIDQALKTYDDECWEMWSIFQDYVYKVFATAGLNKT